MNQTEYEFSRCLEDGERKKLVHVDSVWMVPTHQQHSSFKAKDSCSFLLGKDAVLMGLKGTGTCHMGRQK